MTLPDPQKLYHHESQTYSSINAKREVAGKSALLARPSIDSIGFRVHAGIEDATDGGDEKVKTRIRKLELSSQ
jgi:hypothetical protein